MKPSVLAILWLARLAEVGYRHWPKESSSSETGYQLNQTCSCQCLCVESPPAVSTVFWILSSGILLGASISALVIKSASPSSPAHGSPTSSRRRGGGIITMPARPEGHCVVH